MVRIIDIGNTPARVADWDGAVFSNWQMLDTANIAEFDLTANLPCAAACVCPDAAKKLQGRGIRFISALDQDSKVDFSLADCTTLGADRVANAIALAELFPLPGAVIDCGTAITLELVDADYRFVGGAIAPGRALMRGSLEFGTAQLPHTELLEKLPDEPGLNTVDAIGVGIASCASGVVKEFARAAERKFKLKSLVLTGGDAGFFHQALPEATLCSKEFTLHGVRIGAGF